MSRRSGDPSRQFGDGGGSLLPGSSRSKQKSSPIFSISLVVFVAFRKSGAVLLFGYSFSNRGDYSCTMEVQRAIPVLKKAYGNGMHRVLHVGPETGSVISKLLKQEETEAWGVEPYDTEDADRHCRTLVQKGVVRVSDVKFPLPYRAKSFSLVIVSDTLDYLSPRYLKTLPDLARVPADGLVIFTGYPAQQRAKVADVSKFGRAAKLRSSSRWAKYFSQNNLELNEAASDKFEKAASKMSYSSSCQVFHLMPFH